jgi:putative hydrolase of HD superfamily
MHPGRLIFWQVIKMLLVHDLVEIYAGDTFCYDEAANQDKADRETAAATKLFSLLPEQQGRELKELWQEFEAAQTIESQFANALDRLQPFLQNWQTQGKTWQSHGINHKQVEQRMSPVKWGTPEIWPLVQELIADCVDQGFLRELKED